MPLHATPAAGRVRCSYSTARRGMDTEQTALTAHASQRCLHSAESYGRLLLGGRVEFRAGEWAAVRCTTPVKPLKPITATSAPGVRREKAALSSGCKTHPATAPAGSNRSSYGGDEIAEAVGMRVTNW